MKARPRLTAVLVIFLSLLLSLPVPPAAAQATTRAGEVSRLIPAVSIARGSQQVTAAPKTAVMWDDIVSTANQGRARINLDGGAVLTVGADSQFKITKNDTATQQTEVDLTYGRIRSKVQRLTRPNASFEIRTPTGVAGVVGTDFFLSYTNGILYLLVFEGSVKLCNLAAACVTVGAGMVTTLRAGNQSPDQPRQVNPSETVSANMDTAFEPIVSREGWSGGEKALFWSVLVAVVVAAVVIPLKVRGSDSERSPEQPPDDNGEFRRP